MLRIHYLQHVEFEGPAGLAYWAEKKEIILTGTRVFAEESFPELDDFDVLVVLGGPMNVDDEEKHPWLEAEKVFLDQVLETDKPIVGICLGAQLLAWLLGEVVEPNKEKEIGWFPLTLTEEGLATGLFEDLPEGLPVFHWHGDTFGLPEGAMLLASSQACKHQAFLFQERVLGLQFHLEATRESVQALLEHCADELVPATFVQSRELIAGMDAEAFEDLSKAFDGLMSAFLYLE